MVFAETPDGPRVAHVPLVSTGTARCTSTSRAATR
jgi:hypothetical protein